jgi:acyl-CoA synthetase (AMP-forming)/AMP-acid ligase II
VSLDRLSGRRADLERRHPAWVPRTLAAELLEHCRAGLARFKVPVEITLIEAAELPLTASGKAQKFRLAERALAP